MKRLFTVVLSLVLTGCSTTRTPSNNNQSSQPVAANQPSQPAQPAKPLGALQEGEASGTIVDDGQTILIKYAYAGPSSGDDVVVFLTENPIPPEVLAKAFGGMFGNFPPYDKGLEYKVGKGFWVMYHPSGFQTSGINTLKDFSVENGIVKGRDEDSDDFNGKQYKRSVTFIARVAEKK